MNTTNDPTIRIIPLDEAVKGFIADWPSERSLSSHRACVNALLRFSRAFPNASLSIKAQLPTARKGYLDLTEARDVMKYLANTLGVAGACGAALVQFSGARPSELTSFSSDGLSEAGIIIEGPLGSRLVPWNNASRAWLKAFSDFQGPLFYPRDLIMLERAARTFRLATLRRTFTSYLVREVGPATAADIADVSIARLHSFIAPPASGLFDLTPEACGIQDCNTRVARFTESRSAR